MHAVIEESPDVLPGFFCPRGAALELWKTKAHEVIIAGPADTGKTYACIQKLDSLLWAFPGSQAVMVRKTLVSLFTSCFQTYTKILREGRKEGERLPVRLFGGEKPQWADYPNGSRLFFAGMDNPQKALSSERDFIYVNQAEELSLEDWETLSTRCSGRAGNAPYAQIFGDCNPGAPNHWIKHRDSLLLLHSQHRDNPTIYDAEGNLTDGGKRRLEVLDNLTGLRRARLRDGKWVQAEGAIYADYDAALHVINRFPIPDDWNRYWGVDFGYTNPFVWQAWAEDADGRLYLYKEIYRTQRLVEDHCADILAATVGEPRPRAIIADHDAEDRATLERHLKMSVTPAHKSISDGIQAVQSRLKVAGDGKPRLFLLKDSLVRQDYSLKEAGKPTCTEEEIEAYVWDMKARQERGDVPVKENDHGCDTTRYVVAHVDRIADQKPVDNISPLRRVAGIKFAGSRRR